MRSHCAAPRLPADLRESLPVFPLVPAASVVLKLRNREANDTFFREVCGGLGLTASGGQCRQGSCGICSC